MAYVNVYKYLVEPRAILNKSLILNRLVHLSIFIGLAYTVELESQMNVGLQKKN